MELVLIVSIQLSKDLDNIGISIGATERVSCAVKAQDELLGLSRFSVFVLSVRHLWERNDGGVSKVRREFSVWGPALLPLCGDNEIPCVVLLLVPLGSRPV